MLKKFIFVVLCFLASAPCMGATFGQTGDGTSELQMKSYDIFSTSATLTENNATISKLSFRLRTSLTGTTVYVRGAIYSVNAGVPNTLLATGDIVAIPPNTGTAWYDSSINVTLNSGTYFLAVVSSSTLDSIYFLRYADVGKWAYRTGTIATFLSPPDPFGTPAQTAARQYCIYATYAIAESIVFKRHLRLGGK